MCRTGRGEAKDARGQGKCRTNMRQREVKDRGRCRTDAGEGQREVQARGKFWIEERAG